jgi:SAM-dependent methyltransferase
MAENPPKKGPMTPGAPDYAALYRAELQGEFYGADYYRPPASDIDSAIIYDDGEDKRATAAFLSLCFGPHRALEAGCAMGLLVKALRGWGVEADGFDFSRWCVENAHPAAKAWVRWGDVLDLAPPERPYDLVLALDILEHVPPDSVPRMLANLAASLEPGGLLFTVVPAYGPNAWGPDLYPLAYEEWRRDAAAGVPFKNIPLDDKGRPHLGHLTHAAIGWWEAAFARAGLRRLGDVERILHDKFDAAFEYPRRSFFLFAKAGRFGAGRAARRLRKRIEAVPGLPRGFFEWERWGDVWARWTRAEARDVVEIRGRNRLALRAACHHPDIAMRPVTVNFAAPGGGAETVEFRDAGWRDIDLALPRGEFAVLDIKVSRTWCPEPDVPEIRRRDLGAALTYPSSDHRKGR